MVLRYLGQELSEDELVSLCGTRRIGTPVLSALRALDELGHAAQLQTNLKLDALEDWLGAGLPIIVFLRMSDTFSGVDGAHAVVLTGIDESEVLLINPTTGCEERMPQAVFCRAWASLGSEVLVIEELG